MFDLNISIKLFSHVKNYLWMAGIEISAGALYFVILQAVFTSYWSVFSRFNKISRANPMHSNVPTDDHISTI